MLACKECKSENIIISKYRYRGLVKEVYLCLDCGFMDVKEIRRENPLERVLKDFIEWMERKEITIKISDLVFGLGLIIIFAIGFLWLLCYLSG